MSTKPKKDKTAGEQILFQSNKSDLDIIKWYNNQDNFAKAFRYLVRKHIETYGYVDTKYIIMQEELRKAGMEIPDVAPVAPYTSTCSRRSSCDTYSSTCKYSCRN